MLGEINYDLPQLFAQLGLDNDQDSIDKFIENHQLQAGQRLIDAPFWTKSQQAFLEEAWQRDSVWVEVVDELNVRLGDN